jgi:hypothetical protein
MPNFFPIVVTGYHHKFERKTMLHSKSVTKLWHLTVYAGVDGSLGSAKVLGATGAAGAAFKVQEPEDKHASDTTPVS